MARRFYGVAITYQYPPANKPAAGKMPCEETFAELILEKIPVNTPIVVGGVLVRPGDGVVAPREQSVK